METVSNFEMLDDLGIETPAMTVAAPRVGVRLRAAREAQGLSLPAVAAAIRVRPDYLETIEAGDHAALPAAPYAIGFVRSYAQYLNLDIADIVACFKGEANPSSPIYNCYWREPERQSRLPRRSTVLAAMISALGVYSLWFSFSGQTAEIPGRPVVPDQVLAMAAEERAVAVSAPVVEPMPLLLLTDLRVTAKRRGELTAQYVPDAPDAPAVLVSSAAIVQTQMVTVEALEDAWVHVTRGDKILFSGVLVAGRRYTPPSGEDVMMTTGNAGGVVLHFGDWSSQPMGEPGRVRRDIPLGTRSWRSKLADAGTL